MELESSHPYSTSPPRRHRLLARCCLIFIAQIGTREEREERKERAALSGKRSEERLWKLHRLTAAHSNMTAGDDDEEEEEECRLRGQEQAAEIPEQDGIGSAGPTGS